MVKIFSKNTFIASNLPESCNRTCSAVGEPDNEGDHPSPISMGSVTSLHEIHKGSSTKIFSNNSFRESQTGLENDTQKENPRHSGLRDRYCSVRKLMGAVLY